MEWINIEDKLPEYQERVLISAYKGYENGSEDHCVDIADRRFTNKDGHHWMNSPDTLKGWIVTHWMPLPEPPIKQRL